MEIVVVDSSVVIKWFVAESHSTEAWRLLDEYQTGAVSFAVPDLLFAEVGNIVWKKHRFQGLAADDAERIMDAFRAMSFIVTPSADLLQDAYRLVVAHQRTVYDSMYLALSSREKCRLVTADEALVHAIGAAFPDLVSVANWT